MSKRKNDSVRSLEVFSELWNTEKLCEKLKLKPSYVRDLRSQKRIPFVKIGRQVRYIEEQMYAWVESGQSASIEPLTAPETETKPSKKGK